MRTETRPNITLRPRPSWWNVMLLWAGQRGSSSMCSSARVELHCITMVVELWVAPAPLLVLEIQPEDYGCGGDRREVPCEEQQCFLLCGCFGS